MIPYGGQGHGPKGTKEDAAAIWYVLGTLIVLFYLAGGLFGGAWDYYGIAIMGGCFLVLGWLQRFSN